MNADASQPEDRAPVDLSSRAVGLLSSHTDVAKAAEAMLETDISDAERTKWQAIRDGAMSAGRDVLVQLAAMVMSGQLPR